MIIIGALLSALTWACALSSPPAPLALAGDDDCALYLTGPGRTSAYDYTLNLLRGSFGYEGQHTCITYDAINQAYLEARKRIVVSQPKGDWTAEDIASVGELVLDISVNLARTYGLSYEEIEKGLPLIDTSRTLIAEACPPVFSHVECRAGKYRRLDGLCNNLGHPNWGATNAPFQRLLGPVFADGINAPRVSRSGQALPGARVVSRTMHPDHGLHDHAGTVMLIAWGQFMDHDYTLQATPLDPRNRNDPEECCKRAPLEKHPYCNEIRVDEDDQFYRLFGVKCIDFVRAFPSPRPGCRLGSRVPFNTLTGVIDGNTVYGVTDKFARKLRLGHGGLLRMNDVFAEYGLKSLLPLKLDIPDEGCTRPNKNMYCFEAGEIRVNEQLVLAVMHTLMAREHNRVATGLTTVNPHWDDETLYQEARRINIAEIQHITYNEFLPILLGKDVMEKFGLVLEKDGYWDGYDSSVNPDVMDAFAAAAYRFGHSLLPTAVERWSKAHKFIASKRLSDLIRRPYDLYRAGVLDEYVMGLMNQVAQAMDDSITQEVTNHLFKKVGARFGMDLVSFNMQRGREYGIPGYMEYRKFCGLPWSENFDGLYGAMPNDTVRKYESIFESPIDVDLWSGGVSERPLPGSLLGPTFACIIATQFSYSRRGDRFWYELPNQPSSFTSAQLREVRKARLARIICDNTDIIDTVQLYPFVLPDHELNPRVPCRSGVIPSMDFSKWAEPAPFAAAKQFITEASFSVSASNKTGELTKPNATTHNISEGLSKKSQEITKEHSNDAVTLNNDAKNTEKPASDSTDAILKNLQEDNITKNKNVGHSKNSLKRKKRSANNIRPIIVDYRTSHSGEDSRRTPLALNYETFPPSTELGLLPLPRNTEGFIKNADLASINIETLHREQPIREDNKKESKENSSFQNDESSSKEKKDYPVRQRSEKYNPRDREVQDRDQERRRPESISKPRDYDESSRPNDSQEEIEDLRERDDDRRRPHNDGYKNRREQYPSGKLLRPNVGNDDDDRHSQTQEYSDRDDDYEENNTRSKENSSPVSNEDSRQSYENPDKQRSKQYNFKETGEEPDHPEINSERVRDLPQNRLRYENPDRQRSKQYDFRETGKEQDHAERNSERSRNLLQHRQRYENPERQRSKQYDSRETEEEQDHPENNSERSRNLLQTRQRYENPDRQRSKQYDSRETKEQDHPERNSESRKILPRNGNYNRNNENTQNSGSEEITSSESDNTKPRNAYRDGQSDDRENVNYNHYKKSRPDEDNREFIGDHNKTNRSLPLQDIELQEFSHERVQFDSDGKVSPNYENQDEDLPKANYTRASDEDKSYSSEEPDNIIINKVNGEEIKPVVEINPENDSVELRESDEAEKFDTSKGTSDETLSDERSAALSNQDNKDGVKQEFERIPINYNHEKSSELPQVKDDSKENLNNDDTDAPEDIAEEFRTSSVKNPDVLLNFKLSQSALHIPDIHLPEDVLAYNRENAPEERKQDTEQADDDHVEDESSDDGEDSNEADYGQDHDTYDYKTPIYFHFNDEIEKDSLKEDDENKSQEREEEDEDLYEKFVRERFGKKDSFRKRAKKLQEQTIFPVNRDLKSKIGKLLKKADKSSKLVKKSGDPNAGHFWTLEYAQNV